MIEFENTCVIVTGKLAGVNLPGLPMLDVAGQPLVARAVVNVEKAGLGNVIVATPDNQVADAMRKLRKDVLVAPVQDQFQSSMAASVLRMRDRIKKFSHVLVLPCELADIDALALRRCLAGLSNDNVDVATLAGPAKSDTLWRVDAPLEGEREVAWLRGLTQEGEGYAHIPVYAWNRVSLEKFANTKQGPVAHELAHALAIGLRIAAVKVDTMPMSVDTAMDLEDLRRKMKSEP